MLNSNIRCIEMNDIELYLSQFCELNSNIRCIEMQETL